MIQPSGNASCSVSGHGISRALNANKKKQFCAPSGRPLGTTFLFLWHGWDTTKLNHRSFERARPGTLWVPCRKRQKITEGGQGFDPGINSLHPF